MAGEIFIADKATLGYPNPSVAGTDTVMNYLKKIYDKPTPASVTAADVWGYGSRSAFALCANPSSTTIQAQALTDRPVGAWTYFTQVKAFRVNIPGVVRLMWYAYQDAGYGTVNNAGATPFTVVNPGIVRVLVTGVEIWRGNPAIGVNTAYALDLYCRASDLVTIESMSGAKGWSVYQGCGNYSTVFQLADCYTHVNNAKLGFDLVAQGSITAQD